MVERERRNQAAGLLDGFVAGKKTGAEVYQEWPFNEARDRAVIHILSRVVENRLEKFDSYSKVRDDSFKARIDNCIKFLKTDLDYDWPGIIQPWNTPVPMRLTMLLALFTAVIAVALVYVFVPQWMSDGGFVVVALSSVLGIAVAYIIGPRARFWMAMPHGRARDDLMRHEKYWPFHEQDAIRYGASQLRSIYD
jgi:hypothetical protein